MKLSKWKQYLEIDHNWYLVQMSVIWSELLWRAHGVPNSSKTFESYILIFI